MADSKRVAVIKVFQGTIIHTTGINDFIINQAILGVDTDGKIAFSSPYIELNALKQQFDFDDSSITHLSPTQFLVPGFVDTHIHASQYPNTGLGLDRPLMEWLDKYTYPLEEKFEDKTYARKVYSEVVAHTLRHGTTTASYFTTIHTESAKILSDIMSETGQRGLVGKVCMDMKCPDYYCETLECAILGSKQLIEHIQKLNNPLIQPVLTPRFALTCTEELMKELGGIAEREQLPIQTHIAENKEEVEKVKEEFPGAASYADVYRRCGLLTERTILAHAVYLTQDEIAMCKENNSGISHCPVSNFSLKSGVLDCRRLLEEGLKVGLGTDVSGGYSASILEAMRQVLTASICVSFTKSSDTYKPLSYKEAFYLGTLGGAKVLGLEKKIGSFEAGKEFDALLIDVQSPKSQVYVHPDLSVSELFQKFFYNGDNRNVMEVYVQGRKIDIH